MAKRLLRSRKGVLCSVCSVCSVVRNPPQRIGPTTEHTENTENHPAHFDNTDAASRQLMTRNLRTRLISLLNSATLRALTYQRGACEFFFCTQSRRVLGVLIDR